jgi:hypothetical protein
MYHLFSVLNPDSSLLFSTLFPLLKLHSLPLPPLSLSNEAFPRCRARVTPSPLFSMKGVGNHQTTKGPNDSQNQDSEGRRSGVNRHIGPDEAQMV